MALEYRMTAAEFYGRAPKEQARMVATVRTRDRIRAAQEREAARLAK